MDLEEYREAVRGVPCPLCGSEIGQRCSDRTGPQSVRVHDGRCWKYEVEVRRPVAVARGERRAVVAIAADQGLDHSAAERLLDLVRASAHPSDFY